MTSFHTYLYALNDHDISKVELQPLAYICESEWLRAQKIKHRQNRHTTLMARVLLRRVLSRHLACAATEIAIETAQTGKPQLASHNNFYFNVSHSGDCILVAVGSEYELGVDIEFGKERKSLDDLAEYIMHQDEYALYLAEPAAGQETYFFKTWVLKEAFAKCDGRGIQLGLKNIVTDHSLPSIKNSTHGAHWLAAPEPYYAAIVTKCPAAEAVVHQNVLHSVFEV